MITAALRTYRTDGDFTDMVADDEREHRDLLTQAQLDRAAERADCAIYDQHVGLLAHCKHNDPPRVTSGTGQAHDGRNPRHDAHEQ